ncbi:HipA family kinase [Modestobacter sp. VKM Ac-2978]|uniref:HipA family kinase n=1 Tax=Modestobacter sp. VKM Ac-2978 TaxID=3004132 RepID=UPI0022AAC281|nr:HipA family kinase [Modestobacter sp. VKM Ac-2978]MCZ2850412.1 aminotransferase class I and II [Modestobacter sp. VKM Ac-2978]
MRSTVLPAVSATRYVTPLREGGSLPGLMEADDLGTYVVKWRAAGQGVKVLAAEVVCGELARRLSLPVPALVTVDVVPELAVGEPDQEVQELLRNSAGTNLGMDYLPGALDFEAGAAQVDPELAGRVLWFDALIGNVDRSWRNPNMLFWHGRLHLIDHGAALTFHHNWPGAPAAVPRAYDAAQHALVECDPDVVAADAALAPQVTGPLLTEVLAQVPDAWLEGPTAAEPADEVRARYVGQLLQRLAARETWLPGVVAAAATGGAGRRTAPRGENRPTWLGPPPPEGVTQR